MRIALSRSSSLSPVVSRSLCFGGEKESQPAPLSQQEVLRLSRVKTCFQTNSEGLSGWDFLKRLEGLLKKRNVFVRLFSSAISNKRLLTGVVNDKSFNEQLYRLEFVGLVKRKRPWQVNKDPKWKLSPEARKLLTAADPYQAFQIKESDVQQLVNMELERLGSRLHSRDDAADHLTSRYDRELSALKSLKTALALQAKGAVSLYDTAQSTTKLEDKNNLQHRAKEGLTLVHDHYTKLLQGIKATLHTKKESEGYLQFVGAWRGFYEQKIETMKQSLTQLKQAVESKTLATFINQYFALMAPQEEQGHVFFAPPNAADAKDAVPPILPEPLGDGEKLEKEIQALRAVQTQELPKQIQVLKRILQPQ